MTIFHAPTGDLTVAADRWRELIVEHDTWLAVERGLAPNSLAAYRRDIERYVDFMRRRHREPAQVDESDVSQYVEVLATRYAPSTVARGLVAVRSLHRFAFEEDMLASDPTDAIGAPKVPQGIPKALTEPEVEALLGAVVGGDPRGLRDRAMVETLYASGMRISELVGLDLGDLSLDDGTIRVLGKGSKERVVPVGRAARRAMHGYLDGGRTELMGARPGAAVFLNTRGGRLTRQTCWSIVRRAGEHAGLGSHLSPHVLRHSCATHMLEHGADIRIVQELLGHASVSTTQVYTRVSPERLRAVYMESHPRARAS